MINHLNMCNNIELGPASGTAKSYKKVPVPKTSNLLYSLVSQSTVWKKIQMRISTYWLRPRNSPPFGLIYKGAIGQPRQTTSLCDPLLKIDLKGRYLREILSSPPVLLLCLCQPLKHLLQHTKRKINLIIHCNPVQKDASRSTWPLHPHPIFKNAKGLLSSRWVMIQKKWFCIWFTSFSMVTAKFELEELAAMFQILIRKIRMFLAL